MLGFDFLKGCNTYAAEKISTSRKRTEKSYYKYYLEDMADAPPEHYEKVLRGPIDPVKRCPYRSATDSLSLVILRRKSVTVLCRTDWLYLNLVKMPGVTGEMSTGGLPHDLTIFATPSGTKRIIIVQSPSKREGEKSAFKL